MNKKPRVTFRMGKDLFEDVAIENVQEMIEEAEIVYPDEEYTIVSTKDVPGGDYIAEFTEIEDIITICELLDDYEWQLVDAVIQHTCGDVEYTESLLDEHHGIWDDTESFAINLIEECGYMSDDNPLRYYIDIEKFARDIFINDFIEVDLENGKIAVFSAI